MRTLHAGLNLSPQEQAVIRDNALEEAYCITNI